MLYVMGSWWVVQAAVWAWRRKFNRLAPSEPVSVRVIQTVFLVLATVGAMVIQGHSEQVLHLSYVVDSVFGRATRWLYRLL